MRKRFLLTGLMFLAIVMISGSAWADITSGLIAYYPFNGNANDESGNGNNGTVNGAVLAADRFGNADSAYYFAGNNNSYIQIQDSSVWHFGSQNFTINTWFKAVVMEPTSHIIWNHCNPGISPAHNYSKMAVWQGASGYNVSYGDASRNAVLFSLIADDSIELDQWQHIAFVRNSNQWSIYINGQLAVQDTYSASYQDWTTVYLGVHYPEYTGECLTGWIDEFMVHNRALSEEEILQLYEGNNEIEVTVDIKPGSCDNPLNVKSKGKLPVAILGSVDFDVSEIDPASIRLNGVAPIRSSVDDCADIAGCEFSGPDGFPDLALKFKTQDIVSAIEAMGTVEDGDVITLELTGTLIDGTQMKGQDAVLVKIKGKKGKK